MRAPIKQIRHSNAVAQEPLAECAYARKVVVVEDSNLPNQQGHLALDKALAELDRLEQLGDHANTLTYASVLRLCGNSKSLEAGKRVHSHLAKHGYDQGTYLGNLLVDMYGKCKSVESARLAFGRIHEPNVFSWNIMMAAFAQNGRAQDAKSAFDMIPQRDTVSWNAMIAAYAQNGDVQEARGMFEKMPQWDVVAWNAVIQAYAQTRIVQDAKEIFDRMPQRNVISWNSGIKTYSQNGQPEDARVVFGKMPHWDVISWNLMIAGYAECGQLQKASDMFERMPQPDTVSWNSMIKAYAQEGHLDDAKCMFDKTPHPDLASCTAMVVAYAQQGQLEEARNMFDTMARQDVVAWTAIVSAYAQNGHLQEAKNMFDHMPERNLVSWNAMIAAYGQNGNGKEAIQLFRLMDLEGVQADMISFVSALDGCASHTALAEGKIMHINAAENGYESVASVGNALVNMYGRCGCLEHARALFNRMPQKDVISWTGMVAAYAQNSKTNEAFELFNAMVLEGVQPNEITYIVILSLCSQTGQLSSAWQHFLSMRGDFGVMPVADHYMCVVDLLGRAGQLNFAEDLITKMPFKRDPLAWRTLLSACRNHEDVKRGARAAGAAFELDETDAASYVLLSNTYAESGN